MTLTLCVKRPLVQKRKLVLRYYTAPKSVKVSNKIVSLFLLCDDAFVRYDVGVCLWTFIRFLLVYGLFCILVMIFYILSSRAIFWNTPTVLQWCSITQNIPTSCVWSGLMKKLTYYVISSWKPLLSCILLCILQYWRTVYAQCGNIVLQSVWSVLLKVEHHCMLSLHQHMVTMCFTLLRKYPLLIRFAIITM